ncbi:hypothetical protein SEA_NICOLE72_50 [Microbacterium phage Nicole72]|uniref:Uncharacterized protein n=1 Tax=Microbacterium phage Nicole72 TaxID=3062838 RepID=A0ACD4UJU2_9CAUD|nr:hypothetical protein SEA_NICOLE72_50 [Microbacterium phage Nicole72]
MWTIYAAPSDFPSVPFVVRGHVASAEGVKADIGALGFADTLDEARAYLPAGLVCVGRDPSDDPVIVESWL